MPGQFNPRWDDNSIQFPRLIAEIAATQDNLDITALADEMDIEVSDVVELFNRAQAEYDQFKVTRCLKSVGGDVSQLEKMLKSVGGDVSQLNP